MSSSHETRSRPFRPLNPGRKGRLLWMAATVTLAVALITLAALIRANPESEPDRRLLADIVEWGEESFLDDWYDLITAVTGARWAIIAMAASVVVAPIISKANNAVAFAITLVAIGAADLLAGFGLSHLAGVARPDPSSTTLSFPSGHVAYVVSAGILFVYVAYLRRAHPALIALIAAAALFVIFSVSVGRVVQEAHWPSDILGGYLLGLIGPLIFVPVYHRLEAMRWVTPPRVGIDVPEPDSADAVIAGSYGSAVVIEPSKGTATKYFDPPILMRLLYWASFQDAFPYKDDVAAIEAAIYRRRIAGLLTRYRYGKDLVADITDVRWTDGKAALVTEYVPGREAESNIEAWDFLSQVEVLFDEAGLPGWQLNPHNPHAHTNLIRREDGDFVIVDMESGFVTPFPSSAQMRASFRHGSLPVFDDMDFEKLRQFMAERESDLRRQLGEDGHVELQDAVEKGEAAYNKWHSSEPRIWGRTVRIIYRTLNIRADLAAARRGMASAQQQASRHMEDGIKRWEAEGRIESTQADELRAQLASPDVQIAMSHLGAHLVISAVLRFPFGSIARFLWTLIFMVRAVDEAVRFRGRKSTSGGLKVHNPIVLIWGAIPGFGAVAYIFSGPLMKPLLIRLAIDETIYDLPFRLYQRLGFSRWLPPRIAATD